ncbi:MAG: hypothetical protein NVSMB52_00180 [Chloroflexota bacterium]
MLAGCGSSNNPPFSLSCTTHTLRDGAIRAQVTITNSTSNSSNAIIYGPVFTLLRHFYPSTLALTQVQVEGAHGQTPYIAFLVPHVSPTVASHVILRFAPPPHPQSVLVTNNHAVQASDANALTNPNCTIKK